MLGAIGGDEDEEEEEEATAGGSGSGSRNRGSASPATASATPLAASPRAGARVGASPGALAADMLLALCDVAADESGGGGGGGAAAAAAAAGGQPSSQLYVNYGAQRGGGAAGAGAGRSGGKPTRRRSAAGAGAPVELTAAHLLYAGSPALIRAQPLGRGGAGGGRGAGGAGPGGAPRQKTSAYIGVRRRPWGSYAAEIRNQITGSRECVAPCACVLALQHHISRAARQPAQQPAQAGTRTSGAAAAGLGASLEPTVPAVPAVPAAPGSPGRLPL